MVLNKESHIRFHAAFQQVLDELVAAVAKERERDPDNYRKSPQARLLARIYKTIKSEIPAQPQHPSYYQGEAPGHPYQQWRRAKLDQHHRLFFKWDKESNAIIYAWLNSEVSLVKYRSHMDAYRAFRVKK